MVLGQVGSCPVFSLGQAEGRKESEGGNLALTLRKSQVLTSVLVQSPHNLEQLLLLLLSTDLISLSPAL